jgi:hypothetical protein
MKSIPSLVRPQFSGGIALSLFVSLCCWSGIYGTCSFASATDQATFSWRANPQSDDVVGYRLYLGSQSRFDEHGLVKQNFSYASYLDFTGSKRCALTDSGPVCETYTEAEVDCEGMNGATPSCTLHNLAGKYYFAMTAYNAQAESDYTAELSEYFGIPEEGLLPPENVSDGSDTGEPAGSVSDVPDESESASEDKSDAPDTGEPVGSSSDIPDESLLSSPDDSDGTIVSPEVLANLQQIYMLLRR